MESRQPCALVAFAFSLLLHRPVSAVFSTSDCGTTKSCMRLPQNCDPSSADCVFFSWIWDGTGFDMELSGGTGAGSTYAGVAFGQVDGMQDADLYYCTGAGLESGVITTNQRAPTPLDINTENAVNETTAGTNNGVAECTFRRAASVTKTITTGPKDFDLSSATYYILLARGPISGGNVEYHSSRLISASPVNMTAAPSVATTTPQTTTPASMTTGGASNSACGTTIGCFTYPANCAKTSADCIYFTWAYDSDTNTFNMQLSGGAGGGATYAAVAFGQVNGMQDADLYYCTGNALESGVITQNKQAPTKLDITAENGITATAAATTNGVATCSFTRAASITKTTSSGPQNFDLSQNTYYILLARGAMSSGNVEYHGSSQRAISGSLMDLRTVTGASAAGADILAKTHGAMMITAWLVLANLGVVIARHFKPLWPKTQPGGVKLWFQLHRTIMATVLLMTSIAFIIIFVHVGGYSSRIPAHAIIGIIVMALTITNPVMAFFRPHPNTPKRPIFNWLHYFVGIIARGLGTANLFLGVNAIGGLSSWSIAVMGGFVGYVALTEIILEAVSYHYGHMVWYKGNKKTEDPPVGSSDFQVEEPPVRVRGQGVKTTILVIYALGLIAFAVVFYVDISNH